MRKAILGLIGLLLAVTVVILATQWGVPQVEELDCSISVQSSDGVIYLVDNGDLFSSIYGFDATGNMVFHYQEFRGISNSRITQIDLSGTEALYFLRETDTDGWETALLTIDSDDGSYVHQELGIMNRSGYRVTGFTAPQYVTTISTDGSGEISVFDYASGALLFSPSSSTQAALTASYDAGEEAVVAQMDDGQWVIWGRLGMSATSAPTSPTLTADQLTISLGYRLSCQGLLLIVVNLSLFLLGLALILLLRLFLKGKRLARRATALSAMILLTVLCVTEGYIIQRDYLLNQDTRLTQVTQLTEGLSSVLTNLEPSSLMQSEFYGSDTQQLYASLLIDQGAELFSLRSGSQCSVAVSATVPYGTYLTTDTYDEQIITLVESAQSSSTQLSAVVTIDDVPTLCSAIPIQATGVTVGVLLLQQADYTITYDLLVGLVTLVPFTVAILLVGLLLLLLILNSFTRPMKDLVVKMDSVAEGNFRASRVTAGLDEPGDISRSIQSMCAALSVREYEIKSTLESYNRFIPRGLTELVDRPSVMEVSFGDGRSITGNVGVLTVHNRDEVRAQLNDSDFVEFVNSCFSSVDKATAKYDGCLLSSGFDLSGVNLYYAGTVSAAVSSALDLIGKVGDLEQEHVDPPDYFMLLHRTKFLYGIAGSQNAVFPFLSSQETEFFTSYSARFAETGARIILTNPIQVALDPVFNTRYIGYITLPDGGETYKLYEVLDAYPSLERNLRIRYNDRFQEAIQYYYHSDFYLARNLFSALLRACPSDGIARWYLFACEYYFNANLAVEPNAQLFGVDP